MCPGLSRCSSIKLSHLSLSDISIVTGKRGALTKFATVGVDGRLVVWNSKVHVLASSS